MISDPMEGEKRLKYTDVLANARMLQNVVDLSQIIQQLRREGLQFSSEDVSRLSPYLTHHIRRFGNYVLDLTKTPQPLQPEKLAVS